MNCEELYMIGIAIAEERGEQFLRAELVGPRTAYLYFLRGMEDLQIRRVWPSLVEELKRKYL